jgi:NAD(P)-dependent dehydrogenase (short-subunit alcohol dehydrogenase family)
MIIAKKFIPRFMHLSHESSFSLTSGALGQRPPPGFSVVATAGAAVEGAVRGLAVDVKPVRVNAVFPGAIDTELMARQPEERKKIYVSQTLTGSLGKPEDTAEAYLYLMKDSFVTGSMIHTEGGMLLV